MAELLSLSLRLHAAAAALLLVVAAAAAAQATAAVPLLDACSGQQAAALQLDGHSPFSVCMLSDRHVQVTLAGVGLRATSLRVLAGDVATTFEVFESDYLTDQGRPGQVTVNGEKVELKTGNFHFVKTAVEGSGDTTILGIGRHREDFESDDVEEHYSMTVSGVMQMLVKLRLRQDDTGSLQTSVEVELLRSQLSPSARGFLVSTMPVVQSLTNIPWTQLLKAARQSEPALIDAASKTSAATQAQAAV